MCSYVCLIMYFYLASLKNINLVSLFEVLSNCILFKSLISISSHSLSISNSSRFKLISSILLIAILELVFVLVVSIGLIGLIG